MEIKTEKLKQLCSTILGAVNPNESDRDTRLLTICQENGVFMLQYSNGQYFVEVRGESDKTDDFKVSVDYEKFCKVISCLTTDMVELIPSDDNVTIKTKSGKYVMELTNYAKNLFNLGDFTNGVFNNVFVISENNMDAIYRCNLKEIEKSGAKRPVQKYVYFDADGALSFTRGACVTNFSCTNNSPFLLFNKYVKLFKLFDSAGDVKFETATKQITSEMSTLLIKMTANNISLYMCVEDGSSMMTDQLVNKLRSKANEAYPYHTTFSKTSISRVLNMISIIRKNPFEAFYMEFNKDKIRWYNDSSYCEEFAVDTPVTGLTSSPTFRCDIDDLKKTINSYNSDTVGITFGDSSSNTIILSSDNIVNVIPRKTID